MKSSNKTTNRSSRKYTPARFPRKVKRGAVRVRCAGRWRGQWCN